MLSLFKILLFFSIFVFISDRCYSQDSNENEKKDSLEIKKEEKEKEESETEEIVITGTRIPGKIIDVPFSVFRVDKKEMAYARNVGLKDV